MTHKLPELPYAMDALQPHISKETLEFHYGNVKNGLPTTHYVLEHGKQYTLPVEVVENLESRREPIPRWSKNSEGNPVIVNDQFKYPFSCRQIRKARK